ncbi:hypothetical protein OIU34_23770 [Pararhizobium sp. BT-229]|uniref:hypothetical protein n=1 Tax=Pararhizobium sp. BT-229 TaxID=2986923 RepID=UPI0021F6DBB4|nr:hypothetical protein [Pararhizobium sp. BT-229]MCV9964916.1 hypothetical protein [Pararhizobium sp. BT-229]
MTLEFAVAMNDVVRVLAEEIHEWYTDDELPAAAKAISRIERAVAVLQEAKHEPCPEAFTLLKRYKRQLN